MEKLEELWALDVEEAASEIQVLLKSCVEQGIPKEEVKKQALNIIREAVDRLEEHEAPQELIADTRNSLKLRFVEWFRVVIATLDRNAKKDQYSRLIYHAILGTGNNAKGIEIGIGVPNFNPRDYVTTQENATGQAYYEGYTNAVKDCMNRIAGKQLIMIDSEGKRISVRNLAEMTARYQIQQEELAALKTTGVKYVVASTHVNSSERCQIWQGKVFLLDVNPNQYMQHKVIKNYQPKPIGKVDGISVYSLADAMRHGFLGYNCRHRLVEYRKGMDLFKQYPAEQISKERRLENKQRYYEREIRKAKKQQVLAVTKEDKNKAIARSKDLQAKYKTFCTKNDLTRLEWRTRITQTERGLNINDSKNDNGVRWYKHYYQELMGIDQ